MNADDTAPLVRQPALTAAEVRMETADKAERRHWEWPGSCWCGKRHQAGEALVMVSPPWHRSRWREPVAPAVTW